MKLTTTGEVLFACLFSFMFMFLFLKELWTSKARLSDS